MSRPINEAQLALENDNYIFSFDQPQNDLTTFWGRFMHLQRQTDPRNFFVTAQQLKDSQNLVEKYRNLEIQQQIFIFKKYEQTITQSPLRLNKKDYQKLLSAQSTVNSAISKDTGEEIPRMMRMCAFVPVNVPILFGMILSPPSTVNTIFWQWFNQSFNAGLNYGNRNATSKYTNSDLLLGYSAAVGSSVTTALALRKLFSPLVKRIPAGSPKLIIINSLVASLAGGTASFLNTFCMRQAEMKQGIDIFGDENLTQKIGVSQTCAKKAIIETAFSRVFLAISCLMTPAFIFYAVDKMGRAPRTPALKIPYEISIFLFALMINLPASVAMFPTTGKMKIDMIDEKELNWEVRKGLNEVYYYKGL